MSHTQSGRPIPDDGAIYEIRLQGHLDARWADRFGGMTLTLTEAGETLLIGPVADQAALHGLFKKIRDVGLQLIAVNLIELNQTVGGE